MSWLDHRYTARRLDRFVDDALPARDVDRVASHLICCPECSAGVRLLLRIRASLRSIEANPQTTLT